MAENGNKNAGNAGKMEKDLTYILIVQVLTGQGIDKIEFGIPDRKTFDDIRNQIRQRKPCIIFNIDINGQVEPISINVSNPKVLTVNTTTRQAAKNIILPDSNDIANIVRN